MSSTTTKASRPTNVPEFSAVLDRLLRGITVINTRQSHAEAHVAIVAGNTITIRKAATQLGLSKNYIEIPP